jgi:hypothetical protein
MICFVKPDATAINRVVYYSILLRNIRITLLQLRKTMLLIRGLNITIPSFEDLRDVEQELIHRAEEIQHACRLLLQPLLSGINFGHEKLNHWALSMNDIKCGYCELEEIISYKNDKPETFGKKFILLLSDYEDSTLGKFYSGELIPLEKAIHFVDNIPEKEDKVKGLYDAMVESITTAMRYRQSKMII